MATACDLDRPQLRAFVRALSFQAGRYLGERSRDGCASAGVGSTELARSLESGRVGAEGSDVMRELAGRVAVVTGAASGIGLATARRFASEGMNVVLADIEGGALAEAEQAVKGAGAQTLAVRTDVTS